MNESVDIHIRFLDMLDEAIDDAMGRYGEAQLESLSELHAMKDEIELARETLARALANAGRSSTQEAPRTGDQLAVSAGR